MKTALFLHSTGLKAAALTLMIVVPSQIAAAADAPKVTDILFEAKHIASLEKGVELVYHFERKPSDVTMLGEAFKDDIKLKIADTKPTGTKNIELQIYSGERARDLQIINDLTINPLFVVGLDLAVASFRTVGGGDRAYLKNAFSKQLTGEGAKVEPVMIDYKGAPVEGYRITITPYANDPAKSKMRGYEGSSFSIVVSDKIPGHFAKMVANFTNSAKNVGTLEETHTLDGVGEVK